MSTEKCTSVDKEPDSERVWRWDWYFNRIHHSNSWRSRAGKLWLHRGDCCKWGKWWCVDYSFFSRTD